MSFPLPGLSFRPVPSQAVVAKPVKEKPTKRACSVAGCTNGVVQGGVCVSHGAKRRLCQFPGCAKYSKTAGMCSKHGPKRPPCDEAGCNSISVRGSKCKAHAEPSKKCTVAGCRKAGSIGGLCKSHQNDVHTAMPALPSAGMPSLCEPVVQVPLSHYLAQQNLLSMGVARAQQNMLSMGTAGLPHAYPPMMPQGYYGFPGVGLGLGGVGALNDNAAPLLASSKMGEPLASDALAASSNNMGEPLTSDALVMLELAQKAKHSSDNSSNNDP